jgi:hypothetical protein
MTTTFKELSKTSKNNDSITIVSGLPRSGTSLMMQMLEAGGMSVVTDNVRKADDDNPKGYYEFEKVKTIKNDSSWLKDCQHKAFKMVSELLYYLPDNHTYNVVFMKREMNEILASQRLMLQRIGKEGAGASEEEMAGQFRKHLQNIEIWLSTQSHIKVLYFKYNDIIQDPLTCAQSVNRFLGGWLHEEDMAQIVETSLYRQRSKPAIQEKDYTDDEEEEVKKQLEDLGYL